MEIQLTDAIQKLNEISTVYLMIFKGRDLMLEKK